MVKVEPLLGGIALTFESCVCARQFARRLTMADSFQLTTIGRTLHLGRRGKFTKKFLGAMLTIHLTEEDQKNAGVETTLSTLLAEVEAEEARR